MAKKSAAEDVKCGACAGTGAIDGGPVCKVCDGTGKEPVAEVVALDEPVAE